MLQGRPYLIPAFVAATMLFGALGQWPYGYYQLLRLVVCGVAVYITVLAHQWNRTWAIWMFGFIALLFNPIAVVHLDKDLWKAIDLVIAIIFLVAAFVVRPNKE
jgi:hypothetical protein